MSLLTNLRSTAIRGFNPNAFIAGDIYKSIDLIIEDLLAINAAAGSGGGSSVTAQESIIAFAGGGQGSATACTKLYNYVDTVATIGDSIKALAATNTGVSATFQFFQNNGANELNLYPQTGENFYGLAANLPVTIPAGGVLTIVCATTGSFRYS